MGSPRKRNRRTNSIMALSRLEQLEDRRMLAVVTLNTDTGVAGELRTEIANAAPGELIEFNLPAGQEQITLALGELVIDKSLTIDGTNTAGSGTAVTIDGAGASRVMNIDDGMPANSDVTLSNLTITGGDTSSIVDPYIEDDGGGILSLENLTISDSNVTGNTTLTDGGGIAVNGGVTQIQSSTISSNSAGDDGGAIIVRNGAALELSDQCYVQDNQAFDNGTILAVGTAVGSAPTYLTVDDCTFSGNSVGDDGGGIRSGGQVTTVVNDSTFTNNYAYDRGGAIFAFGYFTDPTATPGRGTREN